ncbi:hypothetical protein [Photobacterium sp. Alg240-V54]|uniref:hypothetical protein n=1 Tax=Photobacterium sp. Alg240-V54 TaxID=2305995 RepID=UPI0013D016A1|nr:hypothetical protein [Photobacterium sp. Alg240-V54]
MSNEVSIAKIVVGNACINFEIPTNLYNIISEHANSEELKLYSYNAETIIDMLRSFVPEDKKPPTHRQESYARTIAKALNLELSDDILNFSESCSEFLDLYSDEYREFKSRNAELRASNKNLISQANKVGRWQSAEAMVKSEVAIEVIADKFGVKPPTIEKYLSQLEEWRHDAKAAGIHDIVQSLVLRQQNGEDIYQLYDEILS